MLLRAKLESLEHEVSGCLHSKAQPHKKWVSIYVALQDHQPSKNVEAISEWIYSIYVNCTCLGNGTFLDSC